MELSKSIENDELSAVITDIKTDKSAYLDDVSNEALKIGFTVLNKPLLHLYNTINSFGDFPSTWSEGLVIPIHKKNDKFDVDNYRGIIISSIIGNVFIKILTNRITKYMEKHKLWTIKQCGFKADHRTEDNLFILNILFTSYVVNKNQNVYIAFVDFSKFFDTINRDMLLYKLLRYGITGPIYDFIKSIYRNTRYQVRIGDQVSPKFCANSGVKQGCCMSPVLSNIFQNDLHGSFSEGCDPVLIGDTSVNSISWADDLMLISTSAEGLQECLTRLHTYCYRWGLEVNTDKTKIMVLGKPSQRTHLMFHFGNSEIENVKEFTYLGFQISSNGNMKATITDRHSKASKMANVILRAINTNSNINVPLAMSLFDKQIVPILLYGSAIWPIPKEHNLLYLEQIPENENTRKIVSETLQKICGKSIDFRYARRVGKRDPNTPRRILIHVKHISDKMELLRNACKYRCVVNNLGNENVFNSELETCQTNYIKKAMNVSKYSSSPAMQVKLGRYPITHRAWGSVIKYWQRLRKSSANVLLNSAYKTVCTEDHPWILSVRYLLESNGFGDHYHQNVDLHDEFYKIFINRLNVQFEQVSFGKIRESNRFTVLHNLKDTFGKSKYIDVIRNADIRLIFTRLRTDLNVLKTCKINTDINKNCPCGCNEQETVAHLLLRCRKFDEARSKFVSLCAIPRYKLWNEHYMLKYILDLECPVNPVNACGRFISKVYNSRKKLRP